MDPTRALVVIGAASGAGAPDPATAEGPDALRHYHVFHDTPLQHGEWDAILRVPRAELFVDQFPGQVVWQSRGQILRWNLFTGQCTTNQLQQPKNSP